MLAALLNAVLRDQRTCRRALSTIPASGSSPSCPQITLLPNLRAAAGEIEPAEVLGAGDGVSEDGPVRRHELHDVGREPGFQQDLVDGVAGEQGGVAGLPQDHVSLRERRKSAQEKRLKPAHGCARLKCSGKMLWPAARGGWDQSNGTLG